MNPCEITASINAIANILAKKLSRKELTYWGIILSTLGEAMTTLAALCELMEGDDQDSDKTGEISGEDSATGQTGEALAADAAQTSASA